MTTTRTLNPLPFDSLEPKRFEDLIRQLIYDFRRWRMLEATGRAGSDSGYDVRGFEIIESVTDEMRDDTEKVDEEDVSPRPENDRLWLIQCKRERVITPAKIEKHLSEIPEEEAKKIYAVVFAAACDFSKKTRDVVISWARGYGISEVHIWGKGEVEDQLFQPKNDHLLFAYFGISLQIRRRSIRTTLRARLAMKRKVMRHLGGGPNDNRAILLRDPEEQNYPYCDPDKYDYSGWRVTTFAGNHIDSIKLSWGKFYAYLDSDGKHWDWANIFNDVGILSFQDPWISNGERGRRDLLKQKIGDFWREKIPEEQRAYFFVEAFIRYDDIIDIDERGDDIAEFPHVFVSFKDGRPLLVTHRGELRVPGKYEEENGRQRISEPRIITNPNLSDRIEIFPREFRKPIRS